MTREENVIKTCQPLIAALGYELIGVELSGSGANLILRIYVDKSTGGISIDEIVTISEQLNPALDVADPIQENYTLEVSSPGLDRPLFSLQDFQKFINSLVKINTKNAIAGRSKFTGIIVAVDLQQQSVTIELHDRKTSGLDAIIAFDNIQKARLVPRFND